ncbi:hypothetical protein CANARDRAFT_29302 [[Candida] arabinofermentans NRRL YB-2248]|uniref:Zinc/iron permease n=1 Tax=[Candida] arabinofermentans NRRL YB-2248 TaxID=983967 RepID=A0A1E4SXD6_9ASCO|nr:hypothetical protein CANARDRAFT_29302 [[Candida] arabinofermentans NRRL YB-2248]
MNQGWLLVILTSLTTACGCSVIYIDLIYKTLFPKQFAKRPFHIQKSTNFLIGSLSLSSGCLLFSSLYKLLPKASKYLKHAKSLESHHRLMKIYLIVFYFSGIVVCSLLNKIIHLLTSESIVHCVHSDHSTHVGDENDDEDELHLHNNGYGAIDEESSMYTNDDPNHTPHVSSQAHFSSHHTPGKPFEMHNSTESTALLSKSSTVKRVSLVDLSLKALRGSIIEGECLGDIDCCQNEIINKYKLHNGSVIDRSELHFCTLPSEENIMFFNKDTKELLRKKSDYCERYPELEVVSPLVNGDSSETASSGSPSSYSAEVILAAEPHAENGMLVHPGPSHSQSQHSHTHAHHSHHHDHLHNHSHSHSHMDDVSSHAKSSNHDDEEHHHHHIQTPLSRLLSIGLQTTLAITLHKFPEGFIMYSTAQADPQLGITIFMSLFIHNFVEGFTMTLPIYIALNSRLKALAISGTLGALSQPMGAVLGWYFFRGNLDLTVDINRIVIGGLIALTSGFLTFIGLQMFASSIGFGGRQEVTLGWCFLGVFLIGLSDILTG